MHLKVFPICSKTPSGLIRSGRDPVMQKAG